MSITQLHCKQLLIHKLFIMKTFTNTIKKAIFICFVLTGTTLLAQSIITIDNNPGSTTTYQNIQDAHDNATAGDIIYVQPSGTSYGSVTIDKALTIIGRSHSEPGKVSQIGSVTVRASNIELKGLQISSISHSSSGAPNLPPYVGLNIYECEISSFTMGSFATGITADDIALRGNVITSAITVYPDATDVLLSNNIFSSGSPITTYNTSSLVVSNNVFKHNSTQMYLYNYDTSGTLLLFNNMFIFTYASSGDVIVNLNSGDFNLSNNLTYAFGGGNVTIQAASSGTFIESNTLANTDPLFTDVDTSVQSSFADNATYNPGARLEDDLTLQAGSPALTGGGGGSEIGLYNNGFLYKTIGNPRGIPTVDVISYDGAVPKNGNINVTIKAKAH